MDPQKGTIVDEWLIPKDKTKVRSFLGFASYYRITVKRFSKTIAPMTNLLKGKNNVIDLAQSVTQTFRL